VAGGTPDGERLLGKERRKSEEKESDAGHARFFALMVTAR
jgi:hypothetical protein